MGILKRILGICQTSRPQVPQCWSYSDGQVRIALAQATELKEKGGAIRLEGGGLPKRVLVVNGEDGQYHAFHNRCTHIGRRRLDPVPGESAIRCCSVGQSKFGYDGTRESGLASRDLVPLEVELDDEHLVVRLDV